MMCDRYMDPVDLIRIPVHLIRIPIHMIRIPVYLIRIPVLVIPIRHTGNVQSILFVVQVCSNVGLFSVIPPC